MQTPDCYRKAMGFGHIAMSSVHECFLLSSLQRPALKHMAFLSSQASPKKMNTSVVPFCFQLSEHQQSSVPSQPALVRQLLKTLRPFSSQTLTNPKRLCSHHWLPKSVCSYLSHFIMRLRTQEEVLPFSSPVVPGHFFPPVSSVGTDRVCPPALQTENQQLSHYISETIAYYCHHGLKHGGRRKKFRKGTK